MASQALLDARLEEFRQLSESLRFYLTLVVSTSTLVLGATGLVLSNLLKKEGSLGLRSLAFLLPAAMCLWLGVGLRKWIGAAVELRDRLHDLGEQLGFELGPRGGILVGTLESLGALFIATAIVLVLVPVVVMVSRYRNGDRVHMRRSTAGS
jgi:hypothetical protein